MDKTLCELFAGVGGFRVGLERSSQEWDTVWANQWEPSRTRQDAYDCYCAHFGKKDIYVNKDIGKIDKSSIPDHTLLVGGFPCQDYSVARKSSVRPSYCSRMLTACSNRLPANVVATLA